MRTRSLVIAPIQTLEVSAQMAIREIRNHADVRKFMFTDHLISVNEHLQWVARLKRDPNQVVFVLLDVLTKNPLGVCSLNRLDLGNGRCDWGFYLAPSEQGHGIGAAVQFRMLEFAFETMNLEKLDGTVIEGNDPVLRFHRRFGFEDEGFRKSELLRDGKRVGIYLLGMTKIAWEQRKPTLMALLENTFSFFNIELKPLPEPNQLTLVDQIEAARAKNNLNWMNLLRVAVEKSPVEAKQLIGEIRKLDQQISELTARLEVEP